MLSLQLSSGYIDIGDISLSLVLNSPLFRENDGSCVMNATLPNSDKLRQLLGLTHRVNNNVLPAEQDVTLGWNGLYFLTGILSVVEATERTVEITIGVSKGDFYSRVKDKSLRDLTLGGERHHAGLYDTTVGSIAHVAGTQYPTYDFAIFPVYNEIFSDPMDEFDGIGEELYQNSWHLSPGGGHYVGSFATPFPYLVYVMKQIFEEEGFDVTENILYDDQELRKLCIYNPIMGRYAGPDWYFYLSEHLPDINIPDFLQEIQKYLGLRIFIDNNTKQVKIKLLNDIITDKNYLSITKGISNIIINHKDAKQGFKFTIKGKGDDDYYTTRVSEILKDSNKLSPVATFANLVSPSSVSASSVCLVIDENVYYKINVDSGVYSWVFFCENINTEYSEGIISDENKIENIESSITPLLMINEFIEKNALTDTSSPVNQFAEVIYWVYAEPNYGGRIIWNGELYVAILDPSYTGGPISTGKMVKITSISPYMYGGPFGDNPVGEVYVTLAHKALMPRVAMKGRIRTYYNEKFKEFGIHLMFNHGLQPLTDYGDYPLGGSDIYDFNGDQITGTYFNLFLDKDNIGIINTFYKTFAYYIQNIAKSVTFTKDFTIVDLKNLFFDRKLNEDGSNYFLDQVKVTFTDGEIKTEEITAYSCL